MLLNPYRFGGTSALEGLEAYSTGLKSLRSLKLKYDGYTGSCLRVRRSSDDAEQDIDFVSGAMDAAIDTTALATFVGANSAYVTKIYDQSGNSDDWIQATSGKQPRIVNAGTYDGFVRFDGSSQAMVSTNNCGAVATYNLVPKVTLRDYGSSTRVMFERGAASGSTNDNAFSIGNDGPTPVFGIYKTESGAYYGSIYDTITTILNGDARWYAVSYAGSGSAGIELWNSTSKLTLRGTVSSGTVGTGTVGTAEKWNMGARAGSSYYCDINWYADAIYEGVVDDTDKVAIMAILDR